MAQRVRVPEPAFGRELLVLFLEPVLVLEAGAVLEALVTIDANHGSAAIQNPLSPVTASTFCSPRLLLPEETDRRDPPRPRPVAPGTSNHGRVRESGECGDGGRCTERGRNTKGDKFESSAESGRHSSTSYNQELSDAAIRPGLTSLKGSSGAGLHSGPLCPSSFRSSKPAGSGFSFGGANDFDSRCTGDRSGSRSCSNKELLNTTRCRLLHHRPIPVAQPNFAALPTGIARTTVPGRHCMETMVCTCSAGCGPWTTQHVVSHLEPR